MAQFYSTRKAQQRKASRLAVPQKQQKVVGLDHQGRGVVRGERGVRFVHGALPGELIDLQPQGKYEAKLLTLHQAAEDRVSPPCPYYDNCGGCDLQHLALPAQRRHKQQVVTELLKKFAGISPLRWLEPLTADAWAYRRRLRLATHWDAKRQRLRIGLRARASKEIVEISECAIAQGELNRLLPALRAFLPQLALVSTLGHIELLQTNQLMVILRLKSQPSAADRDALMQFAKEQDIGVWLHCGGPESKPEALIQGLEPPRYATLEAELDFQPGDFLQAHAQLNVQMVAQALSWLAPEPGDTVLELYAGSGNFTVPMALKGAQVTAIEGVPSMVQRLQQNAERYGVALTAAHADLEQDWQEYLWAHQSFNKVLLDPARAGAPHAISEIARRHPQRIIYISCAPDTLARDTKVLVAAGYQLRQAQIIDMFPQTHHIECLMWFEREA
ncbi:23S rRNA (uracil(1939)-C(5))-methyltransferase RlmD [Pseudidiomarina sp.]|uniref:23S rRNA (uracil(1939)-C(5))-methyltransferase RlmD n=1 Tax=Pseudidiomarina sp. TaxID=2081707 RepID=UPI003A96C680